MLKNEEFLHAVKDSGFDLAGVCSADSPGSIDFYRQWLDKGYGGEMKYLRDSLELRSDLNSVLPGVKSVIMVGLNYYQEPEPRAEDQPRIARYAMGKDYHRVIRGKLAKVADRFKGVYGGEWRGATDSAPIMERELAQRAGLGWFGKNTMLINSQRGSWFLIGSLLTTLEIEPTASAFGGCGSCRACIDACPTGAIVFEDERWQVDSRECISYLTIEKRGELTQEDSEKIGDWTFGCDICQEVCPFNSVRENQPLRSQLATEPGFLDRRTWPGLENLSVISAEEWDLLTRGSAVRRAGHDGLKRNAAANIVNNVEYFA